MTEPVIILGAGLAGLSAGYALGKRSLIFEKDAKPGGAAQSDSYQSAEGSWYFDITGHWLHLRSERTRKLIHQLLGNDLVEIERRSSIFSSGQRTPYPFQAHTYGLPPKVIAECVMGYFEAREKELRGKLPPAKSFEDLIRAKMGDGIARHFMIPYNTKLFTVPPRELEYEWSKQFIPLPTPQEVVLGALLPEGAGEALGYNSRFVYPKEGGIQKLPQALANTMKAKLRLNQSIQLIDWKARFIETDSGQRIAWKKLVSTLPLPVLVERLQNPPEKIRAAAQKLRATRLTWWNIGFAAPNQPDEAHWTYFPESEFPFYRVGSASAAVPSVAPPGHRSYYVETSTPSGTSSSVSEQEVLSGLRRAGLVSADEEPVLCERKELDNAYVIMDHEWAKSRKVLLKWLENQQIFSIGRWGSWIYDSMEGAMLQGLDIVHKIE
ncbi:NAD(P)-binding protein [Myxococcota bacterium]|nr:NAD(P)-binding protein [Myxococcota bacterium]